MKSNLLEETRRLAKAKNRRADESTAAHAVAPPRRSVGGFGGWYLTALAAGVAVWLTATPLLGVLTAAAGLFAVACVRSYNSPTYRRRAVKAFAAAALVIAALIGGRTYFRYQTADVMVIPLKQSTTAAYPEDPSDHSVWAGMYQGRRLRLERRDATHFDFIFEPLESHVAKVTFKNVDVSLMTPSIPQWTKGDEGLTRIALTDRQWNRQQVRFGGPDDGHVTVSGGDGREAKHLYSAELAKNCLNAGLWELLLFVEEDGKKKMYYQGWFTFPLGLYKDLMEQNTGLAYWQHWHYLEHWFDPAGAEMALDKLRKVEDEQVAETTFDPEEPVFAAGEQVRKRRTTVANNIVKWADFYRPNEVQFASFTPPGRYSVNTPWYNEYARIDRFERVLLRKVRPKGVDKSLDELELQFSNSRDGETLRFIVSGVDLQALPQLPVEEYPKGLYMPMGIGVPPFYQSYEDLKRQPPHESPYFSMLVDEDDRWIDHHRFAIDGPVMHRDADDPEKVHLYLLSYERHTLVGHWIIDLPSQAEAASEEVASVRKTAVR